MLLRLLQQQLQQFARSPGVAVVMRNQAAGQCQGVADRRTVVDLHGDIQRLPGGAPRLFGKPLQPQHPGENGQRSHALVVLHAKAVGEAVATTTVGHTLNHLLGVDPRARLVAGKVQRQDAQAVNAQ